VRKRSSVLDSIFSYMATTAGIRENRNIHTGGSGANRVRLEIPRMDWNHYHTLPTMQRWMEEIAAQYPDTVTLQVIGQTVEQRDITVMMVRGRRQGRPGVVVEGGIHAREWMSLLKEALLYLVWRHIMETLPSQRWRLRQLNSSYSQGRNPSWHTCRTTVSGRRSCILGLTQTKSYQTGRTYTVQQIYWQRVSTMVQGVRTTTLLALLQTCSMLLLVGLTTGPEERLVSSGST